MKCLGRFSQLIAVSAALTLPSAKALEVTPYGFIKASVLGASRAVESFANMNLSAPVRVSPFADAGSAESRTSFQLSQSRIGFHIAEKEALSGTLELDFIDFEKATPVTKALPRLRVATIRYKAGNNDVFTIGQDWDVFSPGKPFTFNYIGLYFGAGNAGFQRPQLRWAHIVDKLTIESALGIPGSNPTTTDTDLEKTLVPSASTMLAYAYAPGERLGVSAIVGKLRYSANDGASFYGLNAFFEGKLGSAAELHSELYYGQNLANTGALTLATGLLNESRHEWGGYLTAKVGLTEKVSTQLGVGYADVTEDQGSTLKGVTGYRVKDNFKAEVSLAYRLGSSVDVFAQLTGMRTGFFEEATNETFARTAGIVEGGAVLYF